MDALGIEKAHLVGNSFGGGIALRLATKHPDRVDKMVLMGSMGVPFEITEGLDNVWGFQGTLEHMKSVMGYFAYDKSLTSGDLAQARFEGATQPGFQESFSSMFPAPRQRWVESMTVAGRRDPQPAAPHADRARPRGPGHPAARPRSSCCSCSTTPTCRCSPTAGTGR